MVNGGYEYDVFLSYRRRPPISVWVQEYFADELEQWLDASGAASCRVFIDVDGVETGDDWPARLRRALQRSCVLVSV